MEPDQLSSRAQLFNPVKKFRLRGFILVLFTCILACVFAADSNMALSDLDKLAGVITPLGELRLGAISIVLAVTEMMVQDVPTTMVKLIGDIHRVPGRFQLFYNYAECGDLSLRGFRRPG